MVGHFFLLFFFYKVYSPVLTLCLCIFPCFYIPFSCTVAGPIDPTSIHGHAVGLLPPTYCRFLVVFTELNQVKSTLAVLGRLGESQ